MRFYQIAIYKKRDDNEPELDVSVYARCPKDAINKIAKLTKSINFNRQHYKMCYKMKDYQNSYRCSYYIED